MTAAHAFTADALASPSPSNDGRVAVLVVAAQAGDRAAFAVLYDRFHRMVHAVILSNMRSPNDEARDLVQEVFTKALRDLGSLDDPSRFGGWLATTARRSALDLARAGARARRTITETNDDELANIGRPPPPTSEAREALRAIRDLPETYRETIMMRLVEGLTGPEIAELTGMTADSVRVNLCRGMKLLRERLSNEDAEVTA